MIKLYEFAHCPYCIRVEMGLGFLGKPFDSVLVPYDDMETPVRLIGQKKLPAVTLEDGKSMGESLNILRAVDDQNKLFGNVTSADLDAMSSFLVKLSNVLHPLAIPHWIKFPEFDEGSRKYFLGKQEKKRGTLETILANQTSYLAAFKNFLPAIDEQVESLQARQTFSILDIMLSAHLWPMLLIGEGEFVQAKLAGYLDGAADSCKFNYLQHIKRTIGPL